MSSFDDFSGKNKAEEQTFESFVAFDKLISLASKDFGAGKESEIKIPKPAIETAKSETADKIPSAGDAAVKQLKELLQTASSAGLTCIDRKCEYLGEKVQLFGFDKNTGSAVIGRPESSGKQAEIRQVNQESGQLRDSEGRSYDTIELGGIKLYRDASGAMFAKSDSNGEIVLKELPGLKSVAVSDERLNVSKQSTDVFKGNISVAESILAARPSALGSALEAGGTPALPGRLPEAFLDHLAEVLEKPSTPVPSPGAIAQSNEYAKQHEFSAKLEDGFRTAGQFREFAADGSFAASDRAATVVDRSRDQKLNQVIEDAKKQFSDLPPRERARALADYVNKIMGPQDGNERALDERYRQRMQENAGKEMLLSDFFGEGACTQRALLLKVLADEMGLDSSIVRGNGGTHVWNTFRFDDNKGKSEIFDTRAGIYGVESSPMHHPNQAGADSINGADFTAGQKVAVNGKDWTIAGFDSKDGKINLTRSESRTANESELKQQNPAKDLIAGEKFVLKSKSGANEEWTLQGRNPDGSLQLARVENKAMARKELADSVLELAAPKSPDLKYLQDNWKKLVDDNSKLTDKQKQDLKASLDLFDASGNKKVSDFRKLVDEVGRLGSSTTPDARARVNALSKLANTMANYPEAVHLPVDRLIAAQSVEALTQVADSFAQAAPHEVKPPKEVDGTPSKTGDGYEHAASNALQQALQDKTMVDKMVRDGVLPPGDWVFVPAAKGSVADHFKIDGMLVDLKANKAVMVDFAMHQTGRTPYAKLAEKLSQRNSFRDGTPKQPWALTLNNDSIGWDPSTGLSSGKINSQKILEHLGSYLKGTQPQDLGLAGVHQDKPPVYDLTQLKKALGGELFSFAPVNGQLEADILTQDTGKPVKTTQQELKDIEAATRSSSPEMRRFSLSANAASNAVEEISDGTNFFNKGLRAAVEAAKYGGQESIYKPGSKVPEVTFNVGQDYHRDLPSKYAGKKFIGFTGDDNRTPSGGQREATEVRIYENGDVVVKPGGGTFHKIGNVKELGGSVARELQKIGVDPKQFSDQIKELGKIGKNFAKIEADMKAVNDGTMAQSKFWDLHPELRLLADGVQHNKANERAAQEARPIYEARQKLENNPALSKLPDAEKEALAQKSVQLEKAGQKGLTFEQVRNIIALEGNGLKTADAIAAVRFQQAIGKAAEAWTPAEIQQKFESMTAKNSQTESLYGVDKTKADAIRSKAMDLVKAGTNLEIAHDTAALMVLKNMPQAEAAEFAKTLTEVRLRHPFSNFTALADTASFLQGVRKFGADAIRSQFESLMLEGINKHGTDLAKLKEFLKDELLTRGAGDGAHHESWAKAFDAIDKIKTVEDFAKELGLPSKASAQKAALEGYQKIFKPSQTGDATTTPGQTSVAEVQTQLQGNQTFQKLTDETRMNEALKQLTDRALQRMPASNEERGEFLSKQLKAAMRKQLGVATDAELPESLRNLKVKVVDSDAKAPRVVQGKPGEAAVIEIPSKLLSENAKGALVDAYTHASGLSMLDLLHEKGNAAVTMNSLEPMLSKIAGQAEKIVGARSLVLANQEVKPINPDAAASDRPIVIDPKKPIVTAWDGENLTFAGEKFHVSTEIDKLEKERGEKIKDLEEQLRKAKETAESTKKAEDIAKAQSLETQVANEKQNLRVVSELRLALKGQHGPAAQERARNLVKAAADRAIEERMKPREGGGASLSRAAAVAMVVTTLAFMFVNSSPSQADTYSGSFR